MQDILYADKDKGYAKYLAMQPYFICREASSHSTRAGALQHKLGGNAGAERGRRISTTSTFLCFHPNVGSVTKRDDG